MIPGATVPEPLQRPCTPGRPVQRLVYLKTHKTASTTLKQPLERFGYTRNLSFALAANKKPSGNCFDYDYGADVASSFLPPIGAVRGSAPKAGYKYDMMSIHIRYKRAIMDTFMKEGK